MSRFLLSRQTHSAIQKEKTEKLFGITRILDETLRGTFDDILSKRGMKNNTVPRQEAIDLLNKQLSPIAVLLVRSFPRIAVGYYHGGYEAFIVYESREKLNNVLGSKADENDIGIQAMRERREIAGVVNTFRGEALNCIRPLIRGKEVIGFVTASEKIEDIYSQMQVEGKFFSSPSDFFPAEKLNTSLWMTAKFLLNSIYFQERLRLLNFNKLKEFDNFFSTVKRYIETTYNNLDFGIILCEVDKKVLFCNQYIEKNFLNSVQYEQLSFFSLLREMNILTEKMANSLSEWMSKKGFFHAAIPLFFNGHELELILTGNIFKYGTNHDGLILVLDPGEKKMRRIALRVQKNCP